MPTSTKSTCSWGKEAKPTSIWEARTTSSMPSRSISQASIRSRPSKSRLTSLASSTTSTSSTWSTAETKPKSNSPIGMRKVGLSSYWNWLKEASSLTSSPSRASFHPKSAEPTPSNSLQPSSTSMMSESAIVTSSLKTYCLTMSSSSRCLTLASPGTPRETMEISS